MRIIPVALAGALTCLSLTWLAAAPASAEWVGVPALDGAAHGAQHLLVDRDMAPSMGGALQRTLAPPAQGSSPNSGPQEPAASQSFGAPISAAAIAAAGSVGAALAWILAGGCLGAVALGWRHVHLRNVLDHPTRIAILELVRRQPGLHPRAIARMLAEPPQHVRYHLRTMERMGLVGSQMLAGRRCYHEAGVAPEVRRALLEASRMPSAATRDVMAFILANPGASQSEAARQLGMLPGRARWHLRRLAEHGDLVEARQGKALTYRPRPSSLSSLPRP